MFHLGTATAVATTIAERIRKVTLKYKFARSDQDRFRMMYARADSVEHRTRIMTIISRMKNVVKTPKGTRTKAGVPRDPFEELEMFFVAAG